MVNNGVIASVVVGAVVAAFLITLACVAPCGGPASEAAQHWKSHAERALVSLAFGIFFTTLGLAIGVAAPAIPWVAVGASTESAYFEGKLDLQITGLEFKYKDTLGNDASVANPFALPGAVIAYLGLLFFIVPAWIMAAVAACRLRAVSKHGALPPSQSCCLPGLPAIQALSWVGSIVFLM